MCGGRNWVVHLVIVVFGQASAKLPCDMTTTAVVEEGNLGQTSDFNWLGVLKVHLHDGDSVQVAVSGIVLIKYKHALVNADDVVRIPHQVFMTNTRAMFLRAEDTPWYCQPLSYVTHPEYDNSTINTIAIIELNIDKKKPYLLNPICFPNGAYDTFSHMYLTGYVDENQLLEKVIYKIQYVGKTSCDEFYTGAGLSLKNRMPSSYVCGFSLNNKTQCVWENGMALVSNATGWFTLIGFSVRGPGCAAPARFIDMNTYFPWIDSVIAPEVETYDSSEYDYKRHEDGVEYIPTHELFRHNNVMRKSENENESENESKSENENRNDASFLRYPFDVKKLKQYVIKPYDDNVIAIFPFENELEMTPDACKQEKLLMYAEYFELRGLTGVLGEAIYKLSLYDLRYKICVCVLLKVDALNRTDAILSFKEVIDFGLGTQLTQSSETPEELFKYYPLISRTTPPTNSAKWAPNPNLIPSFLNSRFKSGDVINYDLYIKFQFVESTKLKFEMYSILPSNTTPLPTTTSPPSTNNSRRAFPKSKTGKTWWGSKVNKRVKENVVVVEQASVVQETASGGRRLADTLVTIAVGQLLNYLIK